MATRGAVKRPASAAAPAALGDDPNAELRVLGLPAHASWDEICRAHARLVADLTPGPGASHGNVALAERFLDEVNLAFDALRARTSVA